VAGGLSPESLPVDAPRTPLQAGRVNRVYRVAHPAGDLVLREHATDEFAKSLGADPVVEVQAQRLAADAGLAPSVLHHDAVAGVVWMPFVPGHALENLWWRSAARRKAMRVTLEALRSVQPSADIPTLFLEDRIATLQERLFVADRSAARRLDADCDAARATLANYEWSQAAGRCLVHSDLGPHNVLVNGDGSLMLLDWEYAHVGHVFEDFAGLQVAAGHDAAELRPLLLEWCAAQPALDDPAGRLDALVMARRTLDAQWLALVEARGQTTHPSKTDRRTGP
jgi:aminoglycoside phosphotransferase (APT) family kinase protein